MRAAGVVGVLLVLTGCAGASEESDAEEGMGGMGVPQQLAGEEYPGARDRLTVRVHLAGNGCFLGQAGEEGVRYLVVWPTGTEQGEDGDELRLPDGAVVGHGDVVTGSGLLMATDRLAHVEQDGFWAFAVGFCTPEASEVLVLDRAAVATSPS